jgi:hypothetical protein
MAACWDGINGLADAAHVREQDVQSVGAQHGQGKPATRQILLILDFLSAVTNISNPSSSAAVKRAPFVSSAQPTLEAWVAS